MVTRLHLKIYGDVQGVFFRANTQSAASKIGVSGWVRNLPDGSVEVLAEGEKEKLEKLLRWCRHGPASATVERIEEGWSEGKKEFSDFEVRY